MKKRHIAISLLAGLLCAALLASCQSGPGTETQAPGPANTAPGGEAQPTKAPNYLSDPKFDTEDPLPQYDDNNSWSCSPFTFACATEDALYFPGPHKTNNHLSAEYVMYVDLATGISGVLCGKPECAHSDDQCNAFLRGTTCKLCTYDGKLYWIGDDENRDPAIYRMGLDGTDRVKVCSLPNSLYEEFAANRFLMFHRGYAIFGGVTQDVTDGAARYGVAAAAVSLATGEETVILDQLLETEWVPTFRLRPYRNKLFLISSHAVSREGPYTLDISEWSLKTHELVSLYSQADSFAPWEAWPTEDGLLLSSRTGGEAWRFDLATGELAPLFDFGAGKERSYSKLGFANGYAVGWWLDEAHIPHMRVTDLEGNVVYAEKLDPLDRDTQISGRILMGADDGNLYFQLESHQTVNQTTVVQIPLDGGGTVRELWSVTW